MLFYYRQRGVNRKRYVIQVPHLFKATDIDSRAHPNCPPFWPTTKTLCCHTSAPRPRSTIVPDVKFAITWYNICRGILYSNIRCPYVHYTDAFRPDIASKSCLTTPVSSPTRKLPRTQQRLPNQIHPLHRNHLSQTLQQMSEIKVRITARLLFYNVLIFPPGFTRPTILILLPFRNSALALVDTLITALQESHADKNSPPQTENYSRLQSEYGLPPGTEDKLLSAEPGK
jgi:hypothetical protein